MSHEEMQDIINDAAYKDIDDPKTGASRLEEEEIRYEEH